jgi:hypothetical protein
VCNFIVFYCAASWFSDGGIKYRVGNNQYEPCCASDAFNGNPYMEATPDGNKLRDRLTNRMNVTSTIEINTQTNRHTTRVDGHLAGADYYMSNKNHPFYDYLVSGATTFNLLVSVFIFTPIYIDDVERFYSFSGNVVHVNNYMSI